MAQMLTMARADKPLKSDAKQFYCLLLVQRKDPLFDNCSGFLLFCQADILNFIHHDA